MYMFSIHFQILIINMSKNALISCWTLVVKGPRYDTGSNAIGIILIINNSLFERIKEIKL